MLFKKQFYCEKGNLLLATTKNSNFCKLKYDKITLKFNSQRIIRDNNVKNALKKLKSIE